MLQRIAPALHDVDFATSSMPWIAAAREEYEALRVERDRLTTRACGQPLARARYQGGCGCGTVQRRCNRCRGR